MNLDLAKQSLLGLSIGDAFGDSFFGPEEEILPFLHQKQLPPTKWEFTDDTAMGIGVLEMLEKEGEIKQNQLAAIFARNYQLDMNRGYGGTAHRILRSIGEGIPWKEISTSVFSGMGSMGNGAAMRSGPIGAFFSDDLESLVEQASLASEITHAHPEGIAGGVAVALATAFAHQKQTSGNDFLQQICDHLPPSDTQSKIGKAIHLPPSYDIRTVVSALGNGSKLMAQDTVPIALWSAAHHLDHFGNALWKAVSALGDRDTICAIVGSIVILSAESSTISSLWLDSVEPYLASPFYQARS